jgi:hypothetical protein
VAKQPSNSQRDEIILSEEEIFDVSLATFYAFDRENDAIEAWAPPQPTHKGGGTCVAC